MGTLTDIGIVDLLQFPHSGRRTGELLITDADRTARLYYVDGDLLHATAGELEGLNAVAECVDWTTGEFEFHQGVESERHTIELDLHRTVMRALKLRDDLHAANELLRVMDAGDVAPSVEATHVPFPHLPPSRLDSEIGANSETHDFGSREHTQPRSSMAAINRPVPSNGFVREEDRVSSRDANTTNEAGAAVLRAANTTRREERAARMQASEDTSYLDEQLSKRLRRFVHKTPFAKHAVLIDEEAHRLADSAGTIDLGDDFGELVQVISGLLHEYPRKAFRRLIIDDGDGTVICLRSSDKTLLVSASGAPLGAVSVAAARLAAEIGMGD